MPKLSRRSDEPVIAVTSAQPAHSEELDSRIARYAWMMSLRIVCFVLAVVTPSPWRWGFVVGAVFLPSVAVVLANARKTAKAKKVDAFVAPARPQLDTKK
ncbi:DUF3099 domain-containing protein [Kribbella deserti]|uniref:DUF3099 domain-containing protein n=1 Tax=Kribbella deserti TaxID=1926257 RepID=A0ABV6QLC0_9ACTN